MKKEQQSYNANVSSATDKPPETIFSDMTDTKPYEKSLKTARIWLYVIAAIQLGYGIYSYFSLKEEDEYLGLIVGGIYAGVAALFFGLALWSYKKPTIAFMTALIAYVVIQISTAIIEPTTIYRGIVLKILLIVALVKAFKDAREVEKLRESVGQS